jgi:magnesium transporter
MLPFIMKSVRLDPAVSSSPVIASLVDIVGIIIFFKVAIFYLSTMGWEGGF